MSLLAIRRALETALAAITPALDTAYENRVYTPVNGTPYQAVTLLPAAPGNDEIGPNYTQSGLFQATLFYPADGTGPATAQTRAELIRTTLKRGNSYVSGGVTTTVVRTAEIMPAFIEGDRYVLPVRLQFFASITA